MIFRWWPRGRRPRSSRKLTRIVFQRSTSLREMRSYPNIVIGCSRRSINNRVCKLLRNVKEKGRELTKNWVLQQCNPKHTLYSKRGVWRGKSRNERLWRNRDVYGKFYQILPNFTALLAALPYNAREAHFHFLHNFPVLLFFSRPFALFVVVYAI